MLLIAAIPVLIWCVMLFARGGFWRVAKNLAPAVPAVRNKTVAVVIPARDEAESIGNTVTALLSQDYAEAVPIFLVDDHSTDGTASVARSAGERLHKAHALSVIASAPLPVGWTGKMWALSQGVAAALQVDPDYLLFTDADIVHGPDSVAELVGIAEAGPYDLASFMVKLACETVPERALIPAFVFFFFLLYPPAFIATHRRKTAGAAGGCVLIRPDMLRRLGGIAAIRGEVIDDCALARAAKKNGGRVWLGLTESRRSERSYRTFREIGRMISRTAFRQLNHSPMLLLGTIAGLAVTYMLPVGLLFAPQLALRMLGAVAWLMMAVCYLPTVRFYRQSFLWAFALPAIAAFYAGATVHSAMKYWSGKGGEWKGRAQDRNA